MKTFDFDLYCHKISVETLTSSQISVEITGAELSFLDQIPEEDLIKYLGESLLLNEIGKETCMKHFNLVEKLDD